MKKSSSAVKTRGFTLIEPILILAIFGILLGLSTPYLFGTKEKVLLEAERDKVSNALKISQQNAIAALEGYDYSVTFNKVDAYYTSYTLQPENQTKSLNPKVEITAVTPETITFSRLTGTASASLVLTIASKRFESDLLVSEKGVFSTTSPEKRTPNP